ncbi:hypothetical protein A33M_1376 [Rhodovulum sp. PH10]|uniref:hypothetical protein n=1 Tax=Rhodovulum sp. PH10 TaxID=1187851 RepID=UPI00027C241B|nr:hypothetical protein [Rhodovulum sp. PH10]EJW09403.1 hypothetical protein A33M_1376 [Rhodovulum sp. PH10]
MGALRDFVTEVLEIEGAAVAPIEPDGLEVLAPDPVRAAMGWPELARLGFGVERPAGAIPVGLDGDWLDRFGGLLGERGRWAERQLDVPLPPLGDPARILDKALDLPNAVWRFHGATEGFARCLLLAFRYTAVSDEKREGLVWLAFNEGTGAAIDDIGSRLRHLLAADADWQAPTDDVRRAAGHGRDPAALAARIPLLLDRRVRQELEPFLRAMRRRFERDRSRVHAYHDDLRTASVRKLTALAAATGEKAEADRRRETLHIAAVAREYTAKLDDLRHNYALRVTVDWVQGLAVFAPVRHFEVVIKRRKNERRVRLDWHAAARAAEVPPCDWGPGLERTRLVCDEALHLTEPAGQAPCGACGKPWCRACHPACPRCGAR